MAVDTVVASVQPTADKPLPERRIACVERRFPLSVPAEQVPVLIEALREVLLTESPENGRVGRVCLPDKVRRRVIVLLLTPVNGDLRLYGSDGCPAAIAPNSFV